MRTKKVRILVDANTGEVYEFNQALQLIQQVGTDYSDMSDIRKNLFLARQYSERKQLYLEFSKITYQAYMNKHVPWNCHWLYGVDEKVTEALEAANKFAKVEGDE